MRSVRSPLLFLALAGVVVGAVAAPEAQAAETAAAVFAEPLVAIVPTGGVRAGATREVHVLALDTNGAALEGLTLTASTSAGSVGPVREVGAGLYALAFTAPAKGGDATVTVTGKAGKRSLSATRAVAVPAAPAATLSANPERLVLGRDAAATLTADLGAAQGVLVRASAGSVGKPLLRGAKATAQLTPPKVNFPQVALVTWADAAQPFARQAWQAVPMGGAVPFPVKGAAGASVLLQVDGREFGPVELDGEGKGKVSIEVPPGVQEATQITVLDGTTTEKALDLDIPPTRRIAWMPLPAALPADEALTVPVRLVVVAPDGSPDTGATPTFTVDRGTVGAVRALGEGVYEATWTLPGTPGAAKLEATLPGSDVDHDTLEVAVVDGLGPALSLTTDPSPPKGATKVMVKGATDAQVVVEGAEVGARSVAGTTVTVAIDGIDADALVVRATPTVALSSGPAHRAVLLPARSRVVPGRSVGMLVASVDALGLPVAGVEVSLVAEGPGSVPATVTTGDDGTAWVTVGAAKAGLVALTATVDGGLASGTAVVAAPEAVKVPALPPTDPVGARWAATHPALGGTAPVAAKPVATPVRRFLMVETLGELDGEPPLQVRVTVVDASGQTVEGLIPEVSPSAGTVGEPTVDEASGTVTFPLTLPEDHEGGVEITVREPNGAEEVVTLGEPVAPAPKPVPAAAPTSVAETERTWVRARLSGVVSSYRYTQTPSADPGNLLPATLAVGGQGGSAASPAGLEFDGRLWFDAVDLPWLGVHATTRATWYSIEADIFEQAATDSLLDIELDVLGRVPVELGSDLVWFGGRAGFRYDDFVVFEGCLEAGCTLGYSAVGVAGLGLGPEVGGELGRLFFVGGYSLGLARGTQPFSHSLDLEVGFHVVDPIYVDLGFSSVSRRVELRGADSDLLRGDVSDAQMLGRLGVGVAF